MRPSFFAKFLIFLCLVAVAVWHPIAAAAEQNTAVPTKAAAAKSEPTDVLQKALQLEQNAVIYYLGVRDTVPEELGAGRVDEIVREEMGHIALLSEMLEAFEQEG